MRRADAAITRLAGAVRRASRDQRGLTLIEVLVVITILGILASIISMSMLGITSTASAKARQAEFATVRSAFDTMLVDQGVDPLSNAKLQAGCKYQAGINGPADAIFHGKVGAGQDMKAWPVPDQFKSPYTQDPTALSSQYTRDGASKYGYACDKSGNVVQSDGTTIRTSPSVP